MTAFEEPTKTHWNPWSSGSFGTSAAVASADPPAASSHVVPSPGADASAMYAGLYDEGATPAKKAERKAKEVAKIEALIGEARALEDAANMLYKKGDCVGSDAKKAQAAAKKQAAIDAAIATYEIDVGHAKKVVYDPNIQDEGLTSPEGVVTIGNSAFDSAGWLGSSVGHETEVHAKLQKDKGNWYLGPTGTHLQEVESYQYELDNAERYGTTQDQKDLITSRLNKHLAQLPPEYQAEVAKKHYTSLPGDPNVGLEEIAAHLSFPTLGSTPLKT